MGTTNDEIIYSVRLNVEQTTAALKDFATAAGTAKKANEDFKESQGEVTAASQRQEEAAKKTMAAIQAEEDSIKSIRDENKKLTAERNNTSTATEQGRAKIKALNDALDKNNTVIKENVDAYTKQKIGIGGYSDALDKIVPGLGATVNGIQASTKAALAFIATPLGLVLAALGIAVAALSAYFKGSEEGQNRWNKIVTVGSVIVERFKDVLEAIGGALFNASQESSKFGTAIKIAFFPVTLAIENVKALAAVFERFFPETAAAIKKYVNDVGADAQKLSDLEAEIDVKERALITQRSKTALEVSMLRDKAAKADGAAKAAYIAQAIALEKSLSAAEVQQAVLRKTLAADRVRINGDDKAALKELAEAKAAVDNARAAAFQNTLRMQKELEALRQHDAESKVNLEIWTTAELKKIADMKLTDDDLRYLNAEGRLQVHLTKINTMIKGHIATTVTGYKKQDEQVGGFRMDLSNLLSEIGVDELEDQKKIQEKGNILLNAAAQKEKKLAIAMAIISTLQAFAKDITKGWPIGVILGALDLAIGYANVKKIEAVHFAEGGSTDRSRGPLSGTRISGRMGIPIRRNNGDNLLATVRTGEVILNERQQAMLGGTPTFKRMGVPGFDLGGLTTNQLETRTAFANIQSQYGSSLGSGGGNVMGALDNINNSINNQRPVLIIQDFENAMGRKQQPENAAIVLS